MKSLAFKLVALFMYSIVVIWVTLITIRLDVAQQLNKSYEVRDEHREELGLCYNQLGLLYEGN